MKSANDFVVGLTVIFVAVALVGATLWVEQASMGQRHAKAVARFRDIGNAKVGDAVVIRGVPAGRIEGIELAADGWVQTRLSLDPNVRLPQDPVVLLSESSLFGEWQATITERAAVPKDEAVLRELADATGARDVLPGATLPDLAKLTAVAGQIAGDMATVAGRVEVAFDEQAARELRSSIRNFATLSSTLATTVRAHENDLDTLSQRLEAAANTMNRTALTAQRIASRVDSSTSAGEMKHIVDDISQATADLRATSLELRQMTTQLAQTQGRLDSFLANGDSVLRKVNSGRGSLGMLVNDPTLYRNSDSLMVQLRALALDLQTNPKKYVSLKLF